MIIMPAVLPAPNDQANSSSLTFFLQQRVLLKGSPSQLFRLNTEKEQGIGTQTFSDRTFSLKKPLIYGDLLHGVWLQREPSLSNRMITDCLVDGGSLCANAIFIWDETDGIRLIG